MESALNHKDFDRKYVLVRVPESCLKVGWTTGCQSISVCLRHNLCEKSYLTFCVKSQDSEWCSEITKTVI